MRASPRRLIFRRQHRRRRRRRNQHRFTLGDSISRGPKKQSRVINKEIRLKPPGAAGPPVCDCRGIVLCGLYPWARISLAGYNRVADHCCRCRPIIVAEYPFAVYPTQARYTLISRRRVIKFGSPPPLPELARPFRVVCDSRKTGGNSFSRKREPARGKFSRVKRLPRDS